MKIARFSRIGFIMASAGSAVGLGNIWKFPYITGEYGGGAFVLVYLLTVTFVGFTVLIAEIFIGSQGKNDAVSAFETLAPSNKTAWKYAGFMAFNGLVIMTFYSVVIGWILYYIFALFNGLPTNVGEAEEIFNNLVSQKVSTQIFWHTVATAIVMFVVNRGIKGGIEKVNIYLMPALVIILLSMLIYSMQLDGFSKSLNFMFAPDLSKLDSEALIKAVGHAFFTLSLGMGALLTYSASLPKDASLTKTAFIVTLMDTGIAIIAGLMIFAFLFEFGEQPAKGPGLVFVSLPVIFSHLGLLGSFFALIFFLALAFAGLTSAVSLVEPAVQYFISRFNMSRLGATLLSGTGYYMVGLFALLSYTQSYGEMFSIAGEPIFDILEHVTDAILLPIGGILMVIFVGYVLPKDMVYSHLQKEMGKMYGVWRASLRYVAPLALIFMMLNLFGVIKF